MDSDDLQLSSADVVSLIVDVVTEDHGYSKLADKQNVEAESMKKSRKHLRRTENWKKNQRKRSYNTGKRVKRRDGTALGVDETIFDTRKVKGSCQSNCPRKCSLKLSKDNQDLINKEFWELGDANRRHDFIGSHTTEVSKKQNTGSRRSKTLFYFLPKAGEDRVAVCKTFFLRTLDVSSAVVRKAQATNVPGLSRQRTKTVAHNKTSDELIKHVHDHINLFPLMPSHYCRQRSQRNYLEAGLSVSKMYDLYVHQCSDPKPVSKYVYTEVFHTNFNIGFHRPSKDRCPTCMKAENLAKDNIALSEDEKAKLQLHVTRKEQAKTSKQEEKDNTSNNTSVFTMDLQEVINLPKLSVGPAYYL